MRTGLAEARRMESLTPVGVVLIMCRLQLVAQAVSAALGGRGIRAEAVPWATAAHRATHDLSELDVVVVFDDLEDREAVLAMQSLITQSPARFLVLTHRAEGAAWGAMLASGAVAVMPTDSTLEAVDAALRLVRHGGSPVGRLRRDQLVQQWFAWLTEDDELRERMSRLSPREREVLGLLSVGHTVSDIVDELGVAEATVRSHIKSIRRKLEVGSQLAAVAVLHRLGGGALDSTDRHGPLLPGPRRSRE